MGTGGDRAVPAWGASPSVASKRTKFGNRKAAFRGEEFDSVLERDRWIALKAAEERGEIRGLRRQAGFLLVPAQYGAVMRRVRGRDVEEWAVVEREVRYVADFAYTRTSDGREVVEDTKGVKTQAYVIKRKLMRLNHLPVREVARASEDI